MWKYTLLQPFFAPRFWAHIVSATVEAYTRTCWSCASFNINRRQFVHANQFWSTTVNAHCMRLERLWTLNSASVYLTTSLWMNEIRRICCSQNNDNSNNNNTHTHFYIAMSRNFRAMQVICSLFSSRPTADRLVILTVVVVLVKIFACYQ